MRQIGPTLLVLVFLESLPQIAVAQEALQKRVDELGRRVEQLEAKQRQPATEVRREAGGAVLFLFGAFCALWAQNTNRNPWLWFFLGLFFNVITVLVLLAKNSDDRRQARGEPAAAGSLVAVAILGGLLILAAIGVILFVLLAA
jgi:fatty acid desaturase